MEYNVTLASALPAGSSASQRLAPRSGAAGLASGGAGGLGHALASALPGRSARSVRARPHHQRERARRTVQG